MFRAEFSSLFLLGTHRSRLQLGEVTLHLDGLRHHELEAAVEGVSEDQTKEEHEEWE